MAVHMVYNYRSGPDSRLPSSVLVSGPVINQNNREEELKQFLRDNQDLIAARAMTAVL